MPGLDGTGPMGRGSRTGRGLGRCNPANDSKADGNFQRPFGSGFGQGRGLGRGFGGRGFRRNWSVASMNNNEKKD